MKYDTFIGQVQSRARLGSLGEAVGAIRATLETLGERLAGGEAKDLASQLPREIGYYLFRGATGMSERFGYREFVERVAYREAMDEPVAAYHSRVVMEVLAEAVSLGEFEDVIRQLPGDYSPLSPAVRVTPANQPPGALEAGRLNRNPMLPPSRSFLTPAAPPASAPPVPAVSARVHLVDAPHTTSVQIVEL